MKPPARPSSRRPPAQPTAPRDATPPDPRWDWHRRRLTAARQRLLQTRNEHRIEAAALGEPAVEDRGDQASESTERDLLMAELEVEEQQLAEVEAALERIRTGRYGICERSGQPISWERLRVLPWARTAIESAADKERAGR